VTAMATLTAGVNRPDTTADLGPGGPPDARTTGPAGRDRSAAVSSGTRAVRSWPLLVLAAPAAAEVWSGWVGIAQKTESGLVSPLPGIWPSLHLDTSITLPVGLEAYTAYALRAWLAGEPSISGRTRRFAKWSAISSFALGMAGQVAYHLLAQAGTARAPWPVTTIVSCLPVLVLAMGTTLAHMLRADAAPGHGTRGPAADRPPARSHEDQARPSPDQTASAGTAAETGPAARTATVPRQDHRSGPRTKAPGQTETNQARLIASGLAAAGRPVSRRALRSRGSGVPTRPRTPWRARSTPNWLAPAALHRVLTALLRDLKPTITAGPQRSDPGRWNRNGLRHRPGSPPERCEPRSISSLPGHDLLEDRDYRGAARDAAGIRA